MVLYHYTDRRAFLNVGNLEQVEAELFASLVEKRALFGKGLYATKHEPSVPRPIGHLLAMGWAPISAPGLWLASADLLQQLYQ